MRKTGKDTKIEVEVGTTFYPMSVITTVSSPASLVGKKYQTSVEFLSDQEDLQPIVRLDGVISGFSITPSATYNGVEVGSGKMNLAGTVVEVASQAVYGIPRPLVSGNVRVSALTVDADGTITATSGTEGTTSSTRGAAGGPPFLPVGENLIGYITATYYGADASGSKLITSTEIDSESKERSTIPSVKVIYHDGDGDNKTNYGCFETATALPLIHAATGTGPGTSRRALYASFHEPSFEEVPDCKDFSFNDDIATIRSKAYRDGAEETALSTPSWSASFMAYWSQPEDVLNIVRNSKRWIKVYPDEDETGHWAGRAVIKVSRSMPLEDTLNASISAEGSGIIYVK